MLHVLYRYRKLVHPIDPLILCSRQRQRVALVEDEQYLAKFQRCEVHYFERISHEGLLRLHEQ